MRVAIADDEQEILDQVSTVVKAAGHTVDCFRNGIDLQNALKRETYDVVLLDWNMPGYTGLEIVTWADETLSVRPPFILLTSRREKGEVVRGLEAGASDYIVKPESEDVIRARIEAAGRKTKTDMKERHLTFGAYEFDQKESVVSKDGQAIALTAKEYQLALLFFQNIDRPLSRGYLFSRVWGGNANLETRTIDMHVSRLRSKLELKPHNGFVIRTVFGFGYRMDSFNEEAEAA
ncbi:response regulator transcription factor [Altererythrobacter arenosus]|uniref:Response regulator transcription factor n=1 Tax=Altererythrobacter arenosus TaxID=3032592 RepID=A0ABY8FPX3_9SPHN|nr:response regulator transcription factor [Altererythrobacter sp. CAU 1644]WFL77066.1 response regulator transcription factor [Altererythrobacter sp. CAU 1644]